MAVQTTYPSDRSIAFEGMLGDANAPNIRGMINKGVHPTPEDHTPNTQAIPHNPQNPHKPYNLSVSGIRS